MTHRQDTVLHSGRCRHTLLAATAALALAAACTDPTSTRTAPATPREPQHQATTPPTPTTLQPDPTTTTPPPPPPAVDAPAAEPVRIEIPRIGVSAPVIPLGLDPAGALEVPTHFADTGWWTDGPEPGEKGPAVIAGHVDSTRGTAVFYRLRELQPGDTITVHRADTSKVEFVVDRLAQHPKTAFPTDAVYNPTPGSELRLITCGGAFDRSTGHYVDNQIVFAHRR